MSETKHAKNIIASAKGTPSPSGMTDEEIRRREERARFPIYVDDEVLPGAYCFMAAWWQKITGQLRHRRRRIEYSVTLFCGSGLQLRH